LLWGYHPEPRIGWTRSQLKKVSFQSRRYYRQRIRQDETSDTIIRSVRAPSVRGDLEVDNTCQSVPRRVRSHRGYDRLRIYAAKGRLIRKDGTVVELGAGLADGRFSAVVPDYVFSADADSAGADMERLVPPRSEQADAA
jgi:hypothetical protein